MTKPENCERCGEESDGWPGEKGGELCQMCWETQCSESWWRMLGAWDAIGIDITDPGPERVLFLATGEGR